MENRICALATEIFYPETPPKYFIESLKKYAVFSPGITPEFEILLENKSRRVSELVKSIKWNDAERKLIYVFVLLRERARGPKEEMRLLLKKAALGFIVPYYSEVEMRQTKECVEEEIYEIARLVEINGRRYKKLKNETPQSLSHRYFLSEIIKNLKIYEKSVECAEYDFLEFYAEMYKSYEWLIEAFEINEYFCNRWDRFHKFDSSIDNELVRNVLYKAYNDLTEEYIRTGKINDKYNEYFICDNTVISEKIPNFITNDMADKIAYIGKYILFLKNIVVKKGLRNKRMGLHVYDLNLQNENFDDQIDQIKLKIDLSRKSCVDQINLILQWVNQRLLIEFFDYYHINELLDFISNIFFCRRSDFIEKFFEMLKRSRKFTKNNFLIILEDALESSFPGNLFNKNVDIYIHDEEDYSGLLEAFSLYLNLPYPLSVLLEESFVLKLVYIFKFLWKLKKIDYLSRRIANPIYVNLIYSLMFYVYNEVLAVFQINKMGLNDLAFDLFKATINANIDIIMTKLFINTKEKLIEYLLFHMENTFIVAGKTGIFNDNEIQAALKQFYDYAGSRLENTFLFNLKLFIKD